MVTTESFDLEAYLGSYVPKSLASARWADLGDDVRDLVRLTAPTSEGEAKNLLGALTRYLARMGGEEGSGVPSLTADGIDRFVALERVAGAEDSTLGRVRRQLRRLLAVAHGQVDPVARRTKGGSRPPFDPVTDEEWDYPRRLAAERVSDDVGGNLADFFIVGEACGYDAGSMASAGWGAPEIASLREQILSEGGPKLELHRLFHRWLKGVLSESRPLCDLVAEHGLTRRDLERAVQGFQPSHSAVGALRSA